MEPPTKWNLEGFLVGGFPPILHNLNLSAMQSLLQWLLAKLHKLAHRGHLPVVRLAPLDLLIQVQVDLVDQTQHGSAVDIIGKPTEICCQEYIAQLQELLLGADGLPAADGPAPMSKILIFRVPRSSISCAWHSASHPGGTIQDSMV